MVFFKADRFPGSFNCVEIEAFLFLSEWVVLKCAFDKPLIENLAASLNPL